LEKVYSQAEFEAALQAALVGAEPVAWSYELAGTLLADGQYGNWRPYLTWSKPNVPEGAIRNLKALCERSSSHDGAGDLKLGGYSREDIEAIADGLECYDKTVNVGPVQGEFDELLPSATAAAAKVLRAILSSSATDLSGQRAGVSEDAARWNQCAAAPAQQQEPTTPGVHSAP